MTAPGETQPPAQSIDDIITASGDNKDKVRQLLALLPKLPQVDQTEAVQHVANLVDDDAYGPVSAILTNTASHADVIDVLLTDLLNRKESVKLPILLQIAQIPEHPNQEEARDILEVYLETDHGADWKAWGQALDQWLKANPDAPEETVAAAR